MYLENNQVIIETEALEHRQGWFENFKPEQELDALSDIEETVIEQSEWEWEVQSQSSTHSI